MTYEPIGSEFRVNSTIEGMQNYPAVAALAAGGFLISWTSESGTYAQRYAPDGTATGPELQLNTTSAGSQLHSSGLEGGGFVICWSSYAQDGDWYGVFAQRYFDDGTPAGSEFLVNSTTAGSQLHPSSAALPNGGFVISWTSYGQDGSDGGVYAQLYATDGSAIGGEFRVNTTTAGDQSESSITALADGGFVIAWMSGEAGSYTLYAQRYSADGTAAGSEFQVNAASAAGMWSTSITGLADGGFLVSWRSGNQGPDYSDIYARRFGADGTPAGEEFRVNSETTGFQFMQSVTALADGGFVVCWASDQLLDINASDIYAKVYAADGSATGSEFVVNTTTNYEQSFPVVTALSDGGFVISWVSTGDVYAQRYLADGTPTNVIEGSDDPDSLTGTPGPDLILGKDGDDRLVGFGGDDVLRGGESNDYITGSAGDDLIDGGAGIDRAGWYQTDELLGGATVDLRILGAQDTGSQGWDTLSGIENLSGTPFADILIGDDSANWLWGSPATIAVDWVSETNNDFLDGQGGDDLLTVGIGNHTIIGGSGTDSLRFSENGMPEPGITLYLWDQGIAQATGAGTWTISGIENLSGSRQNDQLGGDGGSNIIAGDLGSDVLQGLDGNDTLLGDGFINIDANQLITVTFDRGVVGGNDTLEGGAGDDHLYGGAGIDTASYANATGRVEVVLYRLGSGNGDAAGADGFDLLYGIENITGSAHDDLLIGNDLRNVLSGGEGQDGIYGRGGDDTIDAGAGDDFLNGGSGDDLLIGGDGYDRAAFFEDAGPSGVTVDLNLQGIAQDTGQGMDTLIGIEHVSGSVFGDYLIGDNNDNLLWGSASTHNGHVATTNNDTLVGGAGNDVLQVGIGNHVLTGGDDVDTVSFTENGAVEPDLTLSLAEQGVAQVTGNGSWTLTEIENLSGGRGNDNLTGDGGANILAGNLGDDLLVGGAGDDTLLGDGLISWDSGGTGTSGAITTWTDATSRYVDGVPGNDVLEGGLGDDIIDGGAGNDTASYANATGGVEIDLGAGYFDGADGRDTLISIENLIGSEFSDGLGGDAGANIIDGRGGNDFIVGGSGDDTIYGGDGNDIVQADYGDNNINAIGNDIVYGGNGNDQLRGGLGDDQLYGGANNDLLRGNGGVDYFEGGADDGEGVNGIGDRVSFFEQRATQGVIADLRTGIISNDGHGNVETMVGIESLGGDTAFVDTFYGNDERNFLAGNRGDLLFGFGGDDLFQMISAAAVLDGGAGVDSLNLFVTANGFLTPDTNGDGLAEYSAAATSGWTVDLSTGTVTDGYGNVGSIANVENVGGTHLADVLLGDANANLLEGRDGDDLLGGGAGNDVLDGGTGTDTASYANATGGVEAYLYRFGSGQGESLGADGADLLSNIENLTGSAFADALVGNNLDNVLTGNGGHDALRGNDGNDTLYGDAGDDFLNGGLGDDLIVGGDGNDRAAFYEDAGPSGVTVDLNLQGIAQDTGQGMDTLIGVENVSGSRYGDRLTGDGGSNVLWGSAATLNGLVSADNNDTLRGNGGDDLLIAGIGNHTIDGGSGIDTFRFSENGAPETGITLSLMLAGQSQASGNGNWVLHGIENLSGSLANDTLTGDGNANILAGDSGDDTMSGGSGDDILYGDGSIRWDGHGTGLSGPITVYADAFNGIAGNDTLSGGDGADFLYGGGGDDVMKGDKGDDTLDGGEGNDSLVGGQGNDRYIIGFNSGADVISGFTHVDRIVFDASSGVTSFEQLTLTQVGGKNTLVTWGNGNSVLIEGLKPRDIVASDFEFAPTSMTLSATQTQERQQPGSGGDMVVLGAVAASGLLMAGSSEALLEGGFTDRLDRAALAPPDRFSDVGTGTIFQAESLPTVVSTVTFEGTVVPGSYATHSPDLPLSATGLDATAVIAPAELLAATQLVSSGQPFTPLLAMGIDVPFVPQMAAVAGAADPGEAIGSLVAAATALPELLDGGPSFAAGIDTLLDSFLGGEGDNLGLAQLGPLEISPVGAADVSLAGGLLLDLSQALVMQHDGIMNV